MSTATLSKGSNVITSAYERHLSQAEKPAASRKPLKIGRGGAAVIIRRHHLTADRIEALKVEYKETKRFPNPYNKGNYHYIIAALVDMGIDEQHPLPRVLARVEKLMSQPDTIQGEGDEATTAWERFVNKDSRNPETGKDVEGRLEQNILVMQRVTGNNPYGLKIRQVGQQVMGRPGGVIDVLVGPKGGKFLRLNTKSIKPINESKTRGMGSPADLAKQEEEANAAKQVAKLEAKAVKEAKLEVKAVKEAKQNAPAVEDVKTPQPKRKGKVKVEEPAVEETAAELVAV